MAERIRLGHRPFALGALIAVSIAGAAPSTAAQDEELARVRREVAGLRGRSFAVDVEPLYLDRPALRLRLIETLRAEGEAHDHPGYTRAPCGSSAWRPRGWRCRRSSSMRPRSASSASTCRTQTR